MSLPNITSIGEVATSMSTQALLPTTSSSHLLDSAKWESTNQTVKIGITIGICANALSVILLIMCLCHRRRKAKAKEKAQKEALDALINKPPSPTLSNVTSYPEVAPGGVYQLSTSPTAPYGTYSSHMARLTELGILPPAYIRPITRSELVAEGSQPRPLPRAELDGRAVSVNKKPGDTETESPAAGTNVVSTLQVSPAESNVPSVEIVISPPATEPGTSPSHLGPPADENSILPTPVGYEAEIPLLSIPERMPQTEREAEEQELFIAAELKRLEEEEMSILHRRRQLLGMRMPK